MRPLDHCDLRPPIDPGLLRSLAHDAPEPPSRVLITADAVGGVFTHACDLASGLRSRGVAVTLALLGPPLSGGQRRRLDQEPEIGLIETGLPLDWLDPEPRAVLRSAEALAGIAARTDADLVHLHSPSLALGGFGMPLVATIHSCVASWWQAVKPGWALPADFAARTLLMARGLAAVQRVICPSASFARTVQLLYGVTPEIIPNGRCAADPPPPRRAPAPFAFTAGRLWDEGKNLAVLDSAAQRATLPIRAAGALVGPHGGRIALAHLETLGLCDEAAIRVILAEVPIFVTAARYEPFGLGVLEAAQAGCALVLSDIPTFRELWDGAAVFVGADDDAGFAARIEGLAADAQARARWGARAQRRAGRFSPQAMVARTLAVYGAARRGAAPAGEAHGGALS